MASKISRNAGILYKLKGLVPENVLKIVYNSLIQSHLNYCSNVWGLGSKSSINKIFTAQKKAVRAVENKFNNCFYNSETGELPCHTKEIFNRNNLLTIHNIIAKNCLASMHKIYLGTAPCNIVSLFGINREINRNSRRDPEYFKIPGSRLKALDKTLYFKGPRLYNNIVNSLNKEHVPALNTQNMFLNPFKNRIAKYFKSAQNDDNIEWVDQNFPLYEV